jgi:hypothetical protein
VLAAYASVGMVIEGGGAGVGGGGVLAAYASVGMVIEGGGAGVGGGGVLAAYASVGMVIVTGGSGADCSGGALPVYVNGGISIGACEACGALSDVGIGDLVSGSAAMLSAAIPARTSVRIVRAAAF